MTDNDLGLALLDSLDDHIAVLDPNGTIVATNAAWDRYARENAGQLATTSKGIDYLEVCRRAAAAGDEMAQAALEGIEAVLAGTRELFSLEYPCDSPSKQRWFILRATPRRDAAGVLVSHVDITRRKLAELEQARLLDQLRVERARLAAILTGASNAIIAVDARTGRVQVNPEAERLFGHPIVPEGGRAQFADQIRDPEGNRLPPDELLSSRALRGETPPRTEVLIVRSDGSHIPCLANAAMVSGPNGDVEGVVIVLQDITSLKELERAREEWTAMIAHDLRQPVTLIRGYAQRLLRSRTLKPADRELALERIAKSTERLDRMVADLFDVSRMASHRLQVSREMVDVPTLLQEILARLRETLPERSLVLVVDGPVPRLLLDPARLEQILGNLVTNAAKYGFPRSEIVVTLTSGARDAAISVTNRGPGIQPEEIPRLFTRFYRTPGARAGSEEGLGLGLHITKGLVEAHGGRIWVESSPGQATTFHFTLPLSQS